MTFIEEASKEFNMEPPLCEHTLRKAIERSQACPPHTLNAHYYNKPAYNAALNDVRDSLESLRGKSKP